MNVKKDSFKEIFLRKTEKLIFFFPALQKTKILTNKSGKEEEEKKQQKRRRIKEEAYFLCFT